MPAGMKWILFYKFLEIPRGIVGDRQPEQLAIETVNEGAVRSTQPHRTFGYCLKDRAEIKR